MTDWEYISSTDDQKIKWATKEIEKITNIVKCGSDDSKYNDYIIYNYNAALDAYKAIVNNKSKPKPGDVGIIIPVLQNLLLGEDL